MLEKLLKDIPVSTKFKSDTIWNMASLSLFGIAGLIVSFAISKFYTPDVLGVFNINFAIIMIVSQLAGGGIHYSILHKTSKYAGDSKIESEIITNGLFAELFSAGIISTVLYFSISGLEPLYDNPLDSLTIVYIIPAIFFLAVNKVILAFYNGKREMRIFALANLLRAVILILSVALFINYGFDPKNIAVVFSLAEIVVFLVFVLLLIKYINFSSITLSSVTEHFNHGIKAFAGTIFMDINTKVDIIMLGYFLNDYAVGIYTLPALIIEGFHQLPLVLRNVVNPLITTTFSEQGVDELEKTLKKGIRLTYKALIPIGLLICVFYPVSIWVLSLNESFYLGVLPLLILAIGTISVVGYFPFVTIFNQLGVPDLQSKFFLIIFLLNVVLNAILIPYLEIVGAASATALSYLITVILLKYFLEKKFSITV